MKAYLIAFLITQPFFTSVTPTSQRRILHQPLFPASSTPPPPATSDNPFLNEHTSDQPPQPPPDAAAEVANNNTATHRIEPPPANNSGKKIAVVVSVGVVTLGMLSGFVFFIYKYNKSKQQSESKQHDNTTTFRYIGTVDNTATFLSTTASESTNGTSNGSPYYKLNSVKLSDRYRPSPELQPLPPLSRPPPPPVTAPASMTSDEEEEIHDFHTPHGSTATTDDGYSVRSLNPKRIRIHHLKKTSPRSRLSVSSSPETTSENPHPVSSPAKQPLPRLHINRSQQKPGIPIPPQPLPPPLPPPEKLGALPIKTTSASSFKQHTSSSS